MESRIYSISENLMLGVGTALFDHIAACLAEFVAEQHLEQQTLPLGFTFSFPVKQEGLAKGSYTDTTN